MIVTRGIPSPEKVCGKCKPILSSKRLFIKGAAALSAGGNSDSVRYRSFGSGGSCAATDQQISVKTAFRHARRKAVFVRKKSPVRPEIFRGGKENRMV